MSDVTVTGRINGIPMPHLTERVRCGDSYELRLDVPLVMEIDNRPVAVRLLGGRVHAIGERLEATSFGLPDGSEVRA